MTRKRVTDTNVLDESPPSCPKNVDTVDILSTRHGDVSPVQKGCVDGVDNVDTLPADVARCPVSLDLRSNICVSYTRFILHNPVAPLA